MHSVSGLRLGSSGDGCSTAFCETFRKTRRDAVFNSRVVNMEVDDLLDLDTHIPFISSSLQNVGCRMSKYSVKVCFGTLLCKQTDARVILIEMPLKESSSWKVSIFQIKLAHRPNIDDMSSVFDKSWKKMATESILMFAIQ